MEPSVVSLIKSISSADFEILSCVDNIRRFMTDVGIQHVLVEKLRTYQYEEVEFLIPQLLHILITFETNSLALEEFILDYSEAYTHFSLIVFWNLQAFVFNLKDSPTSYSFQIVRNLVNKLQDILFNPSHEKSIVFRENIQPALVLCGALAACLGIPSLHGSIIPLIRTQAKQEKSLVLRLASFEKSLTKNLTLKNERLTDEGRATRSDEEEVHVNRKPAVFKKRHSESSSLRICKSYSATTTEDCVTESSDEEEDKLHISTRKTKQKNVTTEIYEDYPKKDNISITKNYGLDQIHHHLSRSMPDLSALEFASDSSGFDLTNSDERSNACMSPLAMDMEHILPPPEKLLRLNYSKGVTEFILALQNISVRLSQLPKEARLSALRAEFTIINDTILPSEIDIPQLLPITSSRNKYHKLLKLSVNEACVLNSAERVPFLVFIEFLSDECDFDPLSTQNQTALKDLQKHSLSNSVTESMYTNDHEHVSETIVQVETDLSDLGACSVRSSSYDLSFLGGVSTDGTFDRKKENGTILLDAITKQRADQMRIASLMLQQLDSSGQASSGQSSAIRQRIVKSMIALQDQFDGIDYAQCNELKIDDANAGERKLENDFKLAEDWKVKKQRIRTSSSYGHLPNWDLCSVIAKNGSDLPQEAFACQLITIISNIWKRRRISTWTKRMKILITSANTGLVETITNAISIHSIKKSMTEISIAEGENYKRRIFTLKDYFERIFGGCRSTAYKRAQYNFAKSLASYSIICYVLQIKDRHNGNIMLDNEGHIIHIDFGFLLSNSPGSVGFEAAPFKLTMEYVDLLDGVDSSLYSYFKSLCKECFLALREESEHIINMVEIMQKDSSLPCFNNGENTSILLKQRLQLHLDKNDASEYVETALIAKSLGSVYTRLYDQFQLITQGIYS